jgi:uncharacterized protein YheU (UPF0270 family)|tara:strand:- start:1035 stop:1265 length:231 start_codon:yes stop_codon:yes gene_type:complete
LIKIPIESLDRSIIFSIIEEFVLREGTDYGAYEVNFQSKIDEIYRKLESDEYSISYDESTESCTIIANVSLDKYCN